ncbi:MAG: LON peptidase substrate-binding domain-containing protein [Verrucomicrobia subdivision 3 bacterium]|nr:LON peptidase substrate-binding domain-containing protein [Limisphaerales bacterium]
MELPSAVPIMTLPSATLFPQALLPLYIFEPRYREMLADSLKSNRMFSVAMQRPGRVRETPCDVAGLGLIRVSVDHADGTSHLILQGIARVELRDAVQTKPYRVHTIRPLQAKKADSIKIDALVAKVQELARQRMEQDPPPFPFPMFKPGAKTLKASNRDNPMEDILEYLEKLTDPDQIADLVSCAMLQGAEQRQTILETVELEPRLKRLIHFLLTEIKRPGKQS